MSVWEERGEVGGGVGVFVGGRREGRGGGERRSHLIVEVISLWT